MLLTEKVFSSGEVPSSCLHSATGSVVIEEESNNIPPINEVPNEDIKAYSEKMIASHNDQVRHAKILMQVTYVTS